MDNVNSIQMISSALKHWQVYFIERWRGQSNISGPGKTFPSFLLSRRAWICGRTSSTLFYWDTVYSFVFFSRHSLTCRIFGCSVLSRNRFSCAEIKQDCFWCTYCEGCLWQKPRFLHECSCWHVTTAIQRPLMSVFVCPQLGRCIAIASYVA